MSGAVISEELPGIVFGILLGVVFTLTIFLVGSFVASSTYIIDGANTCSQVCFPTYYQELINKRTGHTDCYCANTDGTFILHLNPKE